MKRVLVFLLLLLPIIGFCAPAKYALVIGNSNYTNINKLNNPVNDANDMAGALTSMGFKVDKLLNASRVEMENAISRMKNNLRASTDSYGFVFYAGHGVQSRGSNYLIPVDANIPDGSYLKDRAVPVDALLDINRSGNTLNIFVLDACRDNPFSWNRGENRGLAMVQTPADSIIMYATSAGSTASDGTGRNGLFTSYLLKHLKTPGLYVERIFKLTGDDVAKATNKQQHPELSIKFYGDACIGATPCEEQQRVASTPQSPSTESGRDKRAERIEQKAEKADESLYSPAATSGVANQCLVGAPDWVLIGGEADRLRSVGAAQITKQGIQFARTKAMVNARDEMARMISVKVNNILKDFTQITGIGDDETVDRVTTSVAKQLASWAISGTTQRVMWQSPCNELYVQIAADPDAVKKFLKSSITASYRYDNALWQQFQSQKAQDELDAAIADEFRAY
jgi:hypothetical protein